MARLGDVCEIINGYAFRSEKYSDNGIRIIRISRHCRQKCRFVV